MPSTARKTRPAWRDKAETVAIHALAIVIIVAVIVGISFAVIGIRNALPCWAFTVKDAPVRCLNR